MKINNIKLISILFFIVVVSRDIKAQEFTPKTERILNYDSSDLVKKSDTLAFIPPYIFSGQTKDLMKMKPINLYYDDSLEFADEIKSKQVEDYYRHCCYFWYRYSFDRSPKFDTSHFYYPAHFDDNELTIPVTTKYNNGQRLYIPTVSDEDYKAIYLQLKKIENTLNDSLISNVKINDALFQILSKYSSSLCFLTDVKEYWYVGKLKGSNSNVVSCLYRVFVIDMKNKNIHYYNSLISSYRYGPEYIRGDPSREIKHPDSYTRLKPIKYLISGLLRVRQKKK